MDYFQSLCQVGNYKNDLKKPDVNKLVVEKNINY